MIGKNTLPYPTRIAVVCGEGNEMRVRWVLSYNCYIFSPLKKSKKM